MSTLPPYPNYKSVPSRWVIQIPEHWEWLRAKNFLREVDDRSQNGEERLLSMRQFRGLVPHNDVSTKHIGPEHLVGYKKVKPNELVLNRMQAGNAMFFRSRLEGLVSPDYAVFRTFRDDNPEFLGHLFRAAPMRGLFRSESKGLGTGTSGFLRLYSDRFASLAIPIPPRPEQDQIVAYLRAQDAQIARFIKTQQDIIKLMVERRMVLTGHAMMSQATQHHRLDRLGDFIESPINRKRSEEYIPIGMYNRGRGIFHKQPTSGKDLGDSIFYPVQQGDLVFSGQFSWEGAVAVAQEVDHGCIASHRYPIFKCRSDVVVASYLYSFFMTKEGDLILNHHSRGAAGRNRPLNARTLLKEKIPVPPMYLQQEIASYYKEELSVRYEIERQVSQVREYRDRLFADVVTGQVDVRSWQPGPDDIVTEEDLIALGDEDTDAEGEEDDGDD